MIENDKNNNISFPDLVLLIRAELNISQQKLADLLGVKLLTVSRWERGINPPSKKDRIRLLNLCLKNGIEIQEDADD